MAEIVSFLGIARSQMYSYPHESGTLFSQVSCPAFFDLSLRREHPRERASVRDLLEEKPQLRRLFELGTQSQGVQSSRFRLHRRRQSCRHPLWKFPLRNYPLRFADCRRGFRRPGICDGDTSRIPQSVLRERNAWLAQESVRRFQMTAAFRLIWVCGMVCMEANSLRPQHWFRTSNTAGTKTDCHMLEGGTNTAICLFSTSVQTTWLRLCRRMLC